MYLHVLLKAWEASIPYFNTWIRKFHQNYKLFIDVLGRATSIFQIEERDLPCLFMYFRGIYEFYLIFFSCMQDCNIIDKLCIFVNFGLDSQ